MRSMSPEMATHSGMMSPNSMHSGYSQSGYNPVENPIMTYHAQPSPTGGYGYGQAEYAPLPQNHEMATGQEEQSHRYVHELPGNVN
jgi:hypothetical protein